MTDLQTRCLDTFPEWLRSLGDDASAFGDLLANDATSNETRRYLAGALNYFFKSLDLIPDGIEELGYLDDAFVLRVAASLALADAPQAAADSGILQRLGGEAKLIEELLDDAYPRFEAYVRSLRTGAARGRTVDEIIEDRSVCQALVSEVHAFAKGYEAPSFSRDEKNLVKLKAFLVEKLPK